MLNINQLARNSGSFRLRVNDIHLEPGHIVGVFGRNGSGKSTFFGCLAQLKYLNWQDITFYNHPLQPSDKSSITLTLNQKLPKEYNPIQLATMYQKIYPNFEYSRYLEGLKHLGCKENQKLKEGSKGFIQKVSNCLALCSGCKLIMLDEPFGGLDPYARKIFQKLILESVRETNLILISSHQLSELEYLVDSYLFFDQGKAIYYPDLDALREQEQSSLKELVKRGEER